MTACLLDDLDIALVRGDNDPPVIWEFLWSVNPDEPFPIDGSIFELEVLWAGGGFVLSSDSDAELMIDVPLSRLYWHYTTERSASMPVGRVSQYELRRLAGEAIRTLAAGFVDVED